MLTRVSGGWAFENESILESLIWENLNTLFPIQPIARQFICKGEICDIIAVGLNRELVIIEMKNAEDRYLVQQLTRYYDNLISEKPWFDQIDYSQPVRLIGIAPSFHRHNLIDRKYSKLETEFLSFCVQQDLDSSFWISLQNLEQQPVCKAPIPYTEILQLKNVDLPSPPPRLLEVLGGMSVVDREQVLSIREQVLRFDPRIQEMPEQDTILYGQPGKRKQCVEFLVDSKTAQLILFLWVPYQKRQQNFAVGRHRIWTDWKHVTHLASVGTGLGKLRTSREWFEYYRARDLKAGKPPRAFCSPASKLCATKYDYYASRMRYQREDNSLETIVNLALTTWQKKMG
ncbi:recombinase RecB [Phormidesmis sp. 146-33]